MVRLPETQSGMIRNTMAYTLGTATKATGLSKTTLHRAIKSGRISATKKEDGSYEIDPAELHRVFPPVSQRNGSANPDLEQNVTPDSQAGTGMLRRELELLRQERDRERNQFVAQIDALTLRLEQSDQERRDKDRQLTALLTDQREKEKRVGEQDKKLQAIEATLQELRNQNRRIAAELANRGFWKWLLGAKRKAG